MCMSVKKIEDRLVSSNNESCLKKLNVITQEERIDNYSLSMVADSYELSTIYALKHFMSGVFNIYERLCELKQELSAFGAQRLCIE